MLNKLIMMEEQFTMLSVSFTLILDEKGHKIGIIEDCPIEMVNYLKSNNQSNTHDNAVIFNPYYELDKTAILLELSE